LSAPVIDEVYPVNGAIGIVLSDTIQVTFDQEIDPNTVSIIVEGPDTDRWSGPDQSFYDDPTDSTRKDILVSPGYHGLLSGTYTYEYLDEEGTVVSEAYDYTGAGTTYKSKVTFTPTVPFGPNTEYTIYVLGDEESTDNLSTGVSSRTVFDTVKGANLGNGDATFTGGYTGNVNDKYYIEILDDGDTGTARFKWYKQTDPLTERVLTTKQTSQLLDNGVYVRFTDATFVDGDTFNVVTHPPVRMELTQKWAFTTGSGNFETVADDDSISSPALPIGTESTVSVLSIVSTTPEHRKSNITTSSIGTITIKLSASIDSSTVTDDTVTVWTEPVNGDYEGTTITHDGALTKTLSVDGDTITITLT